MMPYDAAEETAERPLVSMPSRKGLSWRWDDYVTAAVGLLFVAAIVFSFRINDWIMHKFAWSY
jgi:hypothetical protein